MTTSTLPPHQANDANYMYYRGLKNFANPSVTSEQPDLNLPKVSQWQGENIDTFYNRILKVARQCEFSDINEQTN